jgi:hypothetical protein
MSTRQLHASSLPKSANKVAAVANLCEGKQRSSMTLKRQPASAAGNAIHQGSGAV